jgi:hypothetical protein
MFTVYWWLGLLELYIYSLMLSLYIYCLLLVYLHVLLGHISNGHVFQRTPELWLPPSRQMSTQLPTVSALSTHFCTLYTSGSQMGVRVPWGLIWSTAGGTQKHSFFSPSFDSSIQFYNMKSRKWTSGWIVNPKTRRKANRWIGKHIRDMLLPFVLCFFCLEILANCCMKHRPLFLYNAK